MQVHVLRLFSNGLYGQPDMTNQYQFITKDRPNQIPFAKRISDGFAKVTGYGGNSNTGVRERLGK